MTAHQEQFDVAIAGGGPAGSSAAIQLALNGARVLLVEDKQFPRPKLCGEFISPECMPHFQRLGVDVEASGGVPIGKTVFYSRRGYSVDVPSDWFRQNTHAVGLSRAQMDYRLLERAKAVGVTVIEDAHASNVIFENGNVRGITTKRSGEAINYRSLITIDATGRHRALARHVEPSVLARKHNLVAFKSHLAGARLDDAACEIYFYRDGYGGLNNVEGGVANLCFIVRADKVRTFNSDPETVMREVVMKNERAAKTLGNARAQTPWLSVSLEGFGRRTVSPAPGLLTVGDAASFIDPFTGSGILMALESGHLAANVIARCRITNGSPDNIAQEYESQYAKTFRSRFRVAGLLRRAAFMPAFTEAAICLCGISSNCRRKIARATRGSKKRLQAQA